MNETKRQLATIQTISKITSIPGADRVELAQVLGNITIVQKKQFKEGDPCVFFEVDSILPDRPEYEFMRPHKHRVKVMRSNRLGVVSQGLVMPIKDLTFKVKYLDKDQYLPINDIANCLPSTPIEELIGYDVTDLLGVKKWEPFEETDAMGLGKGTFPSFIPKTDEMRLQSKMSCLDELKDKLCYITEKCDGTSFTAYQILQKSYTQEDGEIVTDKFGVCSRNMELKDGDNGYWQVAHKYQLPVRLREFCQKMNASYAIQGELCGGKYGHGNPMNLSRNELFVFNIYNISEQRYLNYNEFVKAIMWLGLTPVTTIHLGKIDSLEWLEELSKGLYPNTQNPREGIVIRPQEEIYSPTLQGRLSVKIINSDFALKYEG